MQPAVSAIDCLFADLRVDPLFGCQIFAATDLVLRKRPIATDQHVIILQVGAVGEAGFSFHGLPNSKLPVLVRYLQSVYGPEHEITNYVASPYPFIPPTIEKIKLSELLHVDGAKKVTSMSTFYVPPKTSRDISPEAASDLGLDIERTKMDLDRNEVPGKSYGPHEERIISRMSSHSRPKNYSPVGGPTGLYRLIRKLCLDEHALHDFKLDSKGFLSKEASDLTESERFAMLSRLSGMIRVAMQGRGIELLYLAGNSSLEDMDA